MRSKNPTPARVGQGTLRAASIWEGWVTHHLVIGVAVAVLVGVFPRLLVHASFMGSQAREWSLAVCRGQVRSALLAGLFVSEMKVISEWCCGAEEPWSHGEGASRLYSAAKRLIQGITI